MARTVRGMDQPYFGQQWLLEPPRPPLPPEARDLRLYVPFPFDERPVPMPMPYMTPGMFAPPPRNPVMLQRNWDFDFGAGEDRVAGAGGQNVLRGGSEFDALRAPAKVHETFAEAAPRAFGVEGLNKAGLVGQAITDEILREWVIDRPTAIANIAAQGTLTRPGAPPGSSEANEAVARSMGYLFSGGMPAREAAQDAAHVFIGPRLWKEYAGDLPRPSPEEQRFKDLPGGGKRERLDWSQRSSTAFTGYDKNWKLDVPDIGAKMTREAKPEWIFTSDPNHPIQQVRRINFEHPHLPDLQNTLGLRVFEGDTAGFKAYYDPIENMIMLPRSKDDAELQNNMWIALHEMQHAIQKFEGWHPGTSPENIKNTPAANQMSSALRSTSPDYLNKNFPEYGDWNKPTQDMMDQLAADMAYRATHGEAEARAVMERYANPILAENQHPLGAFDLPPEHIIYDEFSPLGWSPSAADIFQFPPGGRRGPEARQQDLLQQRYEQLGIVPPTEQRAEGEVVPFGFERQRPERESMLEALRGRAEAPRAAPAQQYSGIPAVDAILSQQENPQEVWNSLRQNVDHVLTDPRFSDDEKLDVIISLIERREPSGKWDWPVEGNVRRLPERPVEAPELGQGIFDILSRIRPNWTGDSEIDDLLMQVPNVDDFWKRNQEFFNRLLNDPRFPPEERRANVLSNIQADIERMNKGMVQNPDGTWSQRDDFFETLRRLNDENINREMDEIVGSAPIRGQTYTGNQDLDSRLEGFWEFGISPTEYFSQLQDFTDDTMSMLGSNSREDRLAIMTQAITEDLKNLEAGRDPVFYRRRDADFYTPGAAPRPEELEESLRGNLATRFTEKEQEQLMDIIRDPLSKPDPDVHKTELQNMYSRVRDKLHETGVLNSFVDKAFENWDATMEWYHSLPEDERARLDRLINWKFT